jgi:GNAT superfamily N-acetyltransferase
VSVAARGRPLPRAGTATAGLVPGTAGTAGDPVRYPPATTPPIPDAERVIVDAIPQTASGSPGSGGPALTGLLVRTAEPGDRAALEAMFQRCTPQTIYRRFHGRVKAFPAAYLTEALARVPPHFAIVACDGPRVVALASCRIVDPAGRGPTGGEVAPGASGAAELGILIEDGWQQRGLGRQLLARLVAHANSLGLPELRAQTLTGQDWIIGLLSPYGACASTFGPGVREVRLRLDHPGEHRLAAARGHRAERT